jgi:hypothetical protein
VYRNVYKYTMSKQSEASPAILAGGAHPIHFGLPQAIRDGGLEVAVSDGRYGGPRRGRAIDRPGGSHRPGGSRH